MRMLNLLAKQVDINDGVTAFRNTPGAVLLDVRSSEEYGQGHIPGSTNLPLNRLPAITVEKDVPLFVYCHSGARSRRASAWLEQNGYAVTDIGGIMNYRGAVE